MIKILCVVGTRPEAIKMAPIILALRKETWANVRVLATAQHRQLLDTMLDFFEIKPDIDLNIMQSNQSLAALTARLLSAVDDVLTEEKPDLVIIQGDTTTVLATALASFYRHIPICHIEAGLRTHNIHDPFPEEANRIVVGRLAQCHFTPTENSRQNLLREGIPDNTIRVTGNTVIDALMLTVDKTPELGIDIDKQSRLVLVTAHRRESFGVPFDNICLAIAKLSEFNTNVSFLYPVHPNPNVSRIARSKLSNHPNVILCEPLDYPAFVAALTRCYFVLSDSGGVQEEAPALGKPVLVLRNNTERPEAVASGVSKLVGTNPAKIIQESQKLLDDEAHYRAMAQGISPYGDGRSAERIVNIIKSRYA